MAKKKSILLKSCLFALAIGAALLQTGCDSGKEKGDLKWSYEKAIKAPIEASAGNEELSLGSIEKDKVQVKIPGKSFDSPTKLKLYTPDKVPNVVSKKFEPIGAPVEVQCDAEFTRTNNPVQVTFALDKSTVSEDTMPSDYWVSYYDGNKWEYIRPDSVDLDAGTITFTTCHFSLFGYGKITVDQKIEEYTKNKALADWTQKGMDDKVNKAVEQAVDHILKEKLGMSDESTKKKVLASLLNDDEWANMAKSVKDGDYITFNQNFNVLVGKKIVDNVSEGTLSKLLKGVTEDDGIETLKAASTALGYLAEGRKYDAAKIIGENIADKFVITTVGKVAIAAVENEIQSWKNKEVEAAYQAFKNGASQKWWWGGYNVEKGDFDSVYEQMRGAARQLEIEAVKKQNQIRAEAGYPPLTSEEEDKIKDKVGKDLKSQFERRLKQEEELAKKEQEIKQLVAEYKEKGLLEKGSFGFDKGYDIEQRLDVLMHLKDKILKDTKSKELMASGYNNGKIGMDHIISLTMIWYTEGYAGYAKYIKDNFNIEIYPPAEAMAGSWSGNMTITNITFPEFETQEQEQQAEGDAGCDFNIDWNAIKKELEAMKGVARPMALNVTMDKSGSGNVTITLDGDSNGPMPISYKSGQVSFTISDEGDSAVVFTGYASEDQTSYGLNGNFKFKFPESLEKAGLSISGTWNVSKAKQAPVTVKP